MNTNYVRIHENKGAVIQLQQKNPRIAASPSNSPLWLSSHQREEKIRFLVAVEWIGVIFHKSHFPPTTRQRSGQFFCSSSLVIIASFSFVQPLSAFFSQLSMIQWFNDCWWSSRGPLLQIIPSSWKQLVPTIYLVITSSDHLRARGWIAAAPHIFEPRDHQQQMLYFHHVFCFPLPQTHF